MIGLPKKIKGGLYRRTVIRLSANYQSNYQRNVSELNVPELNIDGSKFAFS